MNEDNMQYKGTEKRNGADFHVYDVDMGEEEEEIGFHMPSGILLDFGGQTQLRYVTYLEVETPERMQEHILTILDGHAANWMATGFSGEVYLKCWNDILEPEHIEPVADVLRQILEGAQGVIDSNQITTADGNRVILRATLTKFARDGSEEALGAPE